MSLVLLAQESEAIKCFVCNSYKGYEGEACDGKPSDKYLVDCSTIDTPASGGNYTMCRKIAQTIEDDYRIVRQCAVDGRKNACAERTGTKDVKVSYCECTGDGCNTASSAFVSTALIFSLVAGVLALRS